MESYGFLLLKVRSISGFSWYCPACNISWEIFEQVDQLPLTRPKPKDRSVFDRSMGFFRPDLD
jgi:hypothetical protein